MFDRRMYPRNPNEGPSSIAALVKLLQIHFLRDVQRVVRRKEREVASTVSGRLRPEAKGSTRKCATAYTAPLPSLCNLYVT